MKILDSIEQSNEKYTLHDALDWWEKKRKAFNIIIGVTGAISMLLLADNFLIEEIFLILIYGAFINIMYSFGFLIEAIECYYLKSHAKLHKLQLFFFIIGTIASVLFTIFEAFQYYYFIKP